MFNSKTKKYNVYTFTETKNDYNELVKAPVLFKTIEMFVAVAEFSPYMNNSLKLQEVTHIGITRDKLEKGMRVGENLFIEFIKEAGRDYLVYLKEIV